MIEEEKFSVRVGAEKPIESFQVDSMDDKLRTALYNGVYEFIYMNEYMSKEDVKHISLLIWTKYFNQPIDDHGVVRFDTKASLKDLFLKRQWFEVYNFIERLFELMRDFESAYDDRDLIDLLKYSLIEHRSGYVLFKKRFVPIVNRIEIDEISNLETKTNKYRLKEVKTHLHSAIELLSLKPEPDLRNSIKESISMVGAVARIIGSTNDLGSALTSLGKKGAINPQLLKGFQNLYNFTNQKNGIRHELMEDSNLDLPTARYFLVSCSAFTNYLISEGLKTGKFERKLKDDGA